MSYIFIHKHSFTLYLIAFVIAAVTAVMLPLLPILVFIPILILLFYIYQENFIISVIIIAFITATSYILDDIRPFLNVLLIFITGIVFFKFYGLDLKSYPRVPKVVLLFLGLLFFSLTISTLFSKDFSVSATATIRTAIFLVICYAFYAFLFKINDTYLYISTIFVAALILSVGIFIQIMEAGFTIFLIEGGLARFSGLYDNPNYVGHMLIISVSFITIYYFREAFRDKIKLFWLTVFLLLNLFMIFAIDSRASALAIFISTSFILLNINKRFYFKIVLSLSLLFLTLYLIPPIQELVDLFMRVERMDTRTYFWEAGIDVISDYPIVGIGPDLFQHSIFNYLPSEAYKFYHPDAWFGKANPHNFFLQLFSENGLLGFMSSISLFSLYFYLGFRSIKITKRKYYDIFLLSTALTGIGLGIFIRAFFEVTGIMSYGYITRDLPFWLLLSILMYINVRYSERKELPIASTSTV
jgi:O-antigen ligase